ncbi:uncharacterized protein DS421_1g12210 [Arachis hypogaea]|nr:uncharacterized protein DS421_1g12210 [Arachis hypogaea]
MLQLLLSLFTNESCWGTKRGEQGRTLNPHFNFHSTITFNPDLGSLHFCSHAITASSSIKPIEQFGRIKLALWTCRVLSQISIGLWWCLGRWCNSDICGIPSLRRNRLRYGFGFL